MRRFVPIAVLLMLLASVASANLGGYVEEIQSWREKFDDGVRKDGWLTLVGRAKIAEGTWSLGSRRAATIVLPAKAPKKFGILKREGNAFQFEPAAGITPTIDGKRLTGRVDLPIKRGSGPLIYGDLNLVVRGVGDDFYLFVDDLKNPAVQEFKGSTWYPIDPAYHVLATFEAYARPQTARVPLAHGDSAETMQSTGDLLFQLGGRTFRLKTFVDDDGLFVMFQDATNGQRTYGGGRFIDVPKPTDGVTTLDFNKAFNPYCSLNAYVMCPIPPAENRLDIAIPAGETFFGE